MWGVSSRKIKPLCFPFIRDCRKYVNVTSVIKYVQVYPNLYTSSDELFEYDSQEKNRSMLYI